MIDDHDKCEWVNVSSCTGSCGCSVQNQQSPKTVLWVRVCFDALGWAAVRA